MTVLSVTGGQVRLGIDAPDSVLVNREEIYERAAEANREAARATRDALTRSDAEEASEMGESS